jgi:hypothetical protein
MTPLILFLSGVLAMGYLVAAMFFLRFHHQSGDRLFAWFSAAFFILAVHRVLVVVTRATEYAEVVYLVRLLAFVLILIAIWEKNRAKTPS